MKDLKSRYLAAIGHVCAAHESPAQAFDRLRSDNPDAFPVPRCNESFLEACAEIVRKHEARAKVTADNVTDEQITQIFGRQMIARPAIVERIGERYLVTGCGSNNEPVLVPGFHMIIERTRGGWGLTISNRDAMRSGYEPYKTLRLARIAASRAFLRARCAEIINARGSK